MGDSHHDIERDTTWGLRGTPMDRMAQWGLPKMIWWKDLSIGSLSHFDGWLTIIISKHVMSRLPLWRIGRPIIVAPNRQPCVWTV